eukprot:COSAG01_NODE_83403_length_100_cov_1198.000000_1_plen_28_part_10
MTASRTVQANGEGTKSTMHVVSVGAMER